MQKILLPTDFSDDAWNAIFTALKIFSKEECRFYLLNAYEPDLMNLLGDKSEQRLAAIYDSLASESQHKLKETLDYLGQNHENQNHSFETISKRDGLVNAVRDLQNQKGFDLVVMGTRGATGAKEVFLGSNTVKVIKHMQTCPIMAVPGDYNFQVLNQIVLPTDYTYSFKGSALALPKILAKTWGAVIHILYASSGQALDGEQQINKKQLEALLHGFRLHFQEVPLQADVSDAIESYVDEIAADLLVLVHHRHGFFEKLTREPVIKKIAFKSEVPLLVIPD
jgi:nucleotide-binding universal stress UspA family protein